MKIQKFELDNALENLRTKQESNNEEINAIDRGRLIRSEDQKVQILNDCNVLEILADTAKFGKENFFDELGVFQPLRWYQPGRMFKAASFLVSIVKQIVSCFK